MLALVVIMHTFNGDRRFSAKRNVHLNKDGAIISIKNAASKQWRRETSAANEIDN